MGQSAAHLHQDSKRSMRPGLSRRQPAQSNYFKIWSDITSVYRARDLLAEMALPATTVTLSS